MSGMKRHFSILKMMVMVSIVAAECCLLRVVSETTLAEMIVVLPLINFMLFGLTRLNRGPRARLFWNGFEATGAALLGLGLLIIWVSPTAIVVLFEPTEWLFENHWIAAEEPYATTIACLCLVVLNTPPQLLVASLLGWLVSRYRIVRRTHDARSIESGEADGPPEDRAFSTSIGAAARPAVG